MEYWQELLLVATGGVSGFMNVMAGGGSLLSMPVLVFLGMDGPIANGTNRVAILAQNLTATTSFSRQGYSDLKLSTSLALCALPGAALGAYVGTKVGGVWFNRILAGVMLAVLLLMWQKRKGGGEGEKTSSPAKPERILRAHLLMTAAGFYGGFIQAGVGFILMAILHRVLSLDLVRVNMHKVFIIGTYTCVALAIFAFRDDVRWIQGGVLAFGNAAGGWVATRLAIKRGERLIRWIFYALLVAMAVKLLLFY